jgi:hypothetical protein
METSERTIDLNFSRKDFEDIYFRDNQANIYFSPQIKNSFIVFLAILVLFISSIAYSLLTGENAWLVPVLLTSLLLALYNYYRKASLIVRWRKSVLEFIDKNSQFKSHKLVLNQNFLSLIQDQTETVARWSVFTKTTIDESQISLIGTDNYLFPKKAMSADDFEFLCEMIKTQLKRST